MCSIDGSNEFETKNEFSLKTIEPRWIQYKGPKRLGCFSGYYNENDKKVYCPDKLLLGYLDLPNSVFIDCLQGYDPNVKYGFHETGNLHISRWVLDNEAILKDFPSDFICYNGLLKDIMMTSFLINDWQMYAAKIKGKIVMIRIHSEEKKNYIDEQSDWHNKSTYVAYNLRRMIIKRDDGQGSEEGIFCHGVFHSKIGSHRILHAAWLDCVESKHELNKPLDEIKLTFIKKYQNNYPTFSYKQATTWWALATLAGVETIICARCDNGFKVENIDKFNVNKLIPRGKQKKCFTVLNLILDYIKSIVTEDNQCYNFCFNSLDKRLTVHLKNEQFENIFNSW